jgi:hypothetical protein
MEDAMMRVLAGGVERLIRASESGKEKILGTRINEEQPATMLDQC